MFLTLQSLCIFRLISPSKLQTPRYQNINNNNYGSGKQRKHSVESMPGDDLEWEANLVSSYEPHKVYCMYCTVGYL